MAKVAIIGGGAAGLTASIYASKNHDVTVFEKNKVCGKKITMTGNGRCNYWNADQDLSHYHSSSKKMLDVFLESFNREEVFSFFEEIGLYPEIKNGYYYPYSLQAASVRNVLLEKAKLQNVQFKNECEVLKIEVGADQKFKIYTTEDTYIFDKVILANGSKAGISEEKNSSGYFLASQLGHKIIAVNPSLVQLVGKASFFKDWAGVRALANCTLYIENQKEKESAGEVQFTNYGVSGICIFNLSRDVKENLEKEKKVEVHFDFLPFLSSDQKTLEWLEKRAKLLKNFTLETMFENLIPYKLLFVLLKQAHLKKEEYWENLREKEKENLVKTLKDFSLEIVDTKGFLNAQACSGGVCLEEVFLNTMESKIVKNLYIIGELLDVDGDCGGYNLGFAWMSGIKAGKSC